MSLLYMYSMCVKYEKAPEWRCAEMRGFLSGEILVEGAPERWGAPRRGGGS